MNKMFSLILAFAVALVFSSQAFAAATTYKYQLQVVDENGWPVTSGVSVRVKTINTDTDSSIWPNTDTTTGTLTGSVTPDSTDAVVLFYSTATSHDVVVNHYGKSYLYQDVTPGGDRRLRVDKANPAEIDLNDTSAIASAADLDIPDAGDFFRVTGTTNVNRISETGSRVGRRVTLLFTGALSIGQADNVSVPYQDGTITFVADQVADFIWDGTNWHMIRPVT